MDKPKPDEIDMASRQRVQKASAKKRLFGGFGRKTPEAEAFNEEIETPEFDWGERPVGERRGPQPLPEVTLDDLTRKDGQ